MPATNDFPICFGPYIRYAISRRFQNFEFEDKPYFDDAKYRLFLLVEFKDTAARDTFMLAIRKRKQLFAQIGPANDDTLHATLRVDTAALRTIEWDIYFSTVEMSLPVSPTGPTTLKLADRANGRARGAQGKLLIGILDSGCPFAAARFLAAANPPGTRVFAIWDQNNKEPVAVQDSSGNWRLFGEKLQDFSYGIEYRREPSGWSGGIHPQMKLDEWIKVHASPDGRIDEDGCYADAEFEPLKYGHSHGAHIMDLFAGSLPPASRVGPPAQAHDPPTWQAGNPGTDPSCSADIVFVQFSKTSLEDHTGVWLKTYALDAIRYILSCADAKTTHIVINLSYGLTTGPHDGTSDIETGLKALVDAYDGSGKPKLDIVVAAGNAFLTDSHVKFDGDGHRVFEWVWRLPPDNTVLCFAEIWMNSHAGDVVVTFTSPSGDKRIVEPPLDVGPNRMWRLEVLPTVIKPNAAADEHGDYAIRVSGVPPGSQVHAYVARTDPNMNIWTGSKASRFVDPEWEHDHSAAASQSYDELAMKGLVDRLGTLNGLATGQVNRLHVAGGYLYMRRDGLGSTYTSAGPNRVATRAGPDYALPGDDSHALLGIRAGGNRSGSVFRLIGTSTAAPQLARHVARGKPLPPTSNDPQPLDHIQVAKRGKGNLPPP